MARYRVPFEAYTFNGGRLLELGTIDIDAATPELAQHQTEKHRRESWDSPRLHVVAGEPQLLDVVDRNGRGFVLRSRRNAAIEPTYDELQAEHEEAVERVYQGRTFPEYHCREHGHGDCAFTHHGPCTGELIDREIARMRAERGA